MKQPKAPTRRQKEIIKNHMLIWQNWMVVEETEQYLVVIYKHGKTQKKLNKNVDKWKERTENVR